MIQGYINETLTKQFTYDYDNTPRVSNIYPNVLSVLGEYWDMNYFVYFSLKNKCNKI